MPVTDEVDLTPQAFKAAQLTPVPREVIVREIRDHIGDAAVEAILVFPDKTPEVEMSWNRLRRLFSWVRDALSSHDPSGRFVYTRACRRKDLQAAL